MPETPMQDLQPCEVVKTSGALQEQLSLVQGHGCLATALSRQTTGASTRDRASSFSSSSLSSWSKSQDSREDDLHGVLKDEVTMGCRVQSRSNSRSPQKLWAEMSDDSSDDRASELHSFAGESFETDSWSDGVSAKTAVDLLVLEQPSSRRAWADIAEDSDEEGPWSGSPLAD